jgi:hypothetical protein
VSNSNGRVDWGREVQQIKAEVARGEITAEEAQDHLQYAERKNAEQR